jgi:hypothetical protein
MFILLFFRKISIFAMRATATILPFLLLAVAGLTESKKSIFSDGVETWERASAVLQQS